MENIVSKKPSFPAEMALDAFIPNPKPITENCNKKVIALLLNSTNGLPKMFTITTPNNKAIGGEIIENKHKKITAAKMACCK